MTILKPGTLVVSCQAGPGNPFFSPEPMALMARAAKQEAAGAIRANGAVDVAAIRAVTDLPIIGLNKLGDPGGVFITPTFESAVGIVEAGADLVALDGTLRPRPDGDQLHRQITRIHEELGVPVLADVDSIEGRPRRPRGRRRPDRHHPVRLYQWQYPARSRHRTGPPTRDQTRLPGDRRGPHPHPGRRPCRMRSRRVRRRRRLRDHQPDGHHRPTGRRDTEVRPNSPEIGRDR